MELYIYVTFLLLTGLNRFSFADNWRGYGVLKRELENLNMTCPSGKTCTSDDFSFNNDCDCETFCVRFGTCCFDSPNLYMPSPKIKPTCRRVDDNESGYFMISECPQNGETKSAYDGLCREDANDLMRLVPVTSVYTHITYKNYFCFLCHEKNNDYVFWNINVRYDRQADVKQDDPNLHVLYDEYYKTWVAPVGEGGRYYPVTLEYRSHTNLDSTPKLCRSSHIAECSQYWPKDDVRDKCYGYTLLTVIEREGNSFYYKNPHCALCNYEDLKNKVCLPPGGSGYGVSKKPFSFTFLLDVNQSDGDKVGKIQRCPDSEVWDPFFKRCRAVTCAIPGYVVRGDTCVQA